MPPARPSPQPPQQAQPQGDVAPTGPPSVAHAVMMYESWLRERASNADGRRARRQQAAANGMGGATGPRPDPSTAQVRSEASRDQSGQQGGSAGVTDAGSATGSAPTTAVPNGSSPTNNPATTTPLAEQVGSNRGATQPRQRGGAVNNAGTLDLALLMQAVELMSRHERGRELLSREEHTDQLVDMLTHVLGRPHRASQRGQTQGAGRPAVAGPAMAPVPVKPRMPRRDGPGVGDANRVPPVTDQPATRRETPQQRQEDAEVASMERELRETARQLKVRQPWSALLELVVGPTCAGCCVVQVEPVQRAAYFYPTADTRAAARQARDTPAPPGACRQRGIAVGWTVGYCYHLRLQVRSCGALVRFAAIPNPACCVCKCLQNLGSFVKRPRRTRSARPSFCCTRSCSRASRVGFQWF